MILPSFVAKFNCFSSMARLNPAYTYHIWRYSLYNNYWDKEQTTLTVVHPTWGPVNIIYDVFKGWIRCWTITKPRSLKKSTPPSTIPRDSRVISSLSALLSKSLFENNVNTHTCWTHNCIRDNHFVYRLSAYFAPGWTSIVVSQDTCLVLQRHRGIK